MVVLPHRRKLFRSLGISLVSTSYTNPGGSGDRTGTITITQSSSNYPMNSYVNFYQLINGGGASNIYFPNGCPNGEWLRFDFGSAKVINEFKLLQGSTTSQGIWKVQGSNDASSWTDIGSSFTMGADANPSICTAISSNNTYYRYYQIVKTGGSTNQGPWIYEFEFKISL